MSVRPLMNLEEEIFQKMLKPFDPTESGEDGCVDEQPRGANDTRGESVIEDEAIQPRTRAPPVNPSREEVEWHMTTHLPFRSWCPHCVRGKSKGGAHRKQQNEHKEVPTVVLDYTFMHESQEEREEKGMPILVVKDIDDGHRGTGMMFAMVVPSKGVQSYAVKTLADIIGQLGHHEVILKSDGEPAIVALKEAAKRERKERIVI